MTDRLSQRRFSVCFVPADSQHAHSNIEVAWMKPTHSSSFWKHAKVSGMFRCVIVPRVGGEVMETFG